MPSAGLHLDLKSFLKYLSLYSHITERQLRIVALSYLYASTNAWAQGTCSNSLIKLGWFRLVMSSPLSRLARLYRVP